MAKKPVRTFWKEREGGWPEQMFVKGNLIAFTPCFTSRPLSSPLRHKDSSSYCWSLLYVFVPVQVAWECLSELGVLSPWPGCFDIILSPSWRRLLCSPRRRLVLILAWLKPELYLSPEPFDAVGAAYSNKAGQISAHALAKCAYAMVCGVLFFSLSPHLALHWPVLSLSISLTNIITFNSWVNLITSIDSSLGMEALKCLPTRLQGNINKML